MMRKATLWTLVALAAFLLNHTSALAQRNLALYSMPGLHQATHVNPSFLPDAHIVIGLPVFGNVQAGLRNTGFTLKDLGAKSWDIRGMSLDYPKLLPLVKESNIASGGLSTNLLLVGFRMKNDYIAFEASEHVVGNAYFPMDAIQLGADLKQDIFEPGQMYNLDEFSYDLTHFRNYSLTYARKFGRASAGVRFRYLVGLENYSTAGPGVVLTATESMNVYQVDGQLQLWSAGASSLSGDGSYPISGQGNYGFAFDFGSTYAIGERLTASFSVLNVGGIDWNRGVRRRGIANEITDPHNEVEDIFHGFIYNKPATQLSYSTALPTLVFVGGAYEMKDNSQFNLLLNSRYVQGRHNLALAFSHTRNLSKAIRASLTYAATNESLANLGAGMTIQLGPVQLWGASDNLLSIVNPAAFNNAHFNVGINLTFKKKPEAPIALADTMAMDSMANQVAMVTTPPEPVPQAQPAQPSAPQPAQPTAPKTTRPQAQPTQPPAPQPTRPQAQPAQPTAPKAAQPQAKPTQPSASQPTQPSAPKPAPPQVQPAQPSAPKIVRLSPRSSGDASAAEPAGSSAHLKKYTLVKGAIKVEGTPGKVDHYFFDVYKINPDGQRELVRTGRMMGGDYKLYLEKEYEHEVSIKTSGSGTLILKVEKGDLLDAGPAVGQDLVLPRISSTGDMGAAIERPPAEVEEAAEPVDDLMTLSVPEIKQEEAEALQRPVPQEESGSLWVNQPDRSLQLKRDISIYKDMNENSRVLARLSVGAEVEVLERTTSEWWMVAYRSRIGWVQVSQLR